MQKKPSIPPAGEAILAGDIEAMRRLAEDGSLLFKKGKVVELRRNIPTVIQDGKKDFIVFIVQDILEVFVFLYEVENFSFKVYKNCVEILMGIALNL